MQFIKQWFGTGRERRLGGEGGDGLGHTRETVAAPPRLRAGVLGTGKIGVDLLLKLRRSSWLEPVMFVGRNLDSEGMRYAANLGVPVSDKGIAAFVPGCCDLVFDATTAASHLEHAQVFDKLGIFALDMTPSQIGECCVPALGMVDHSRHRNISMVSCGGQSSIPLAQVLYQQMDGVHRLAVSSRVSANSVGPGTLANIQEYYCNTRAGLHQYTSEQLACDVELIADQERLDTPMLTSITAWGELRDRAQLEQALALMCARVQAYVPGYRLLGSPEYLPEGAVRIQVQVEGAGDYLPTYAGNLDIINCAAVAVAEDYARTRLRAALLRGAVAEAEVEVPRVLARA